MSLLRKLIPGALLVTGCLATGLASAEFHDQGHDQGSEDAIELRIEAARKIQWTDPRAADPRAWVRFKLLGINDFHGQLESRTVAGRPAGGAAVLTSYLHAAEATARDGAIVVHAGDQVGASPPVSALLQDEPSISFLNLLANQYCDYRDRLDARCNLVGTLGNHEFDEGTGELLRLLDGGNHPDGPFLEETWRGARYPTVSANVVWADSGEPLLPRSVIKRIRGIPVAVIGAVLKETPTIVTPSGVAGLQFMDEADAINAEVARLKQRGVHAMVVAIHQGTRQASFTGATPAAPTILDGAIGAIVARLDDEVDIVVSGHAHGFTNALMTNSNGKPILVTQAFSASTAYDDIDVAIDPATRDVVQKSAAIVTTWGDAGPGLTPDPEVAELVAAAAETVAPLVSRVIGIAAADITRAESPAGESALGNLIADAQRDAMNTEIALMNPGGIRADVSAGEVTWGELFAVQPFNNDLVSMTLTGAQIVELLDQQWIGQPFARIMKSSGLTYTWRENGAGITDNRVDPASIRVNGSPLNPATSYSITVNSFMASGGDNFTVLTQGTDRVIGPVDLDALVEHIASLAEPFSATIEGRITKAP
ncbi:MAG: bifunctional metallophosphatase/5'-nucleotidase [Gammaproteobacteria bacterium]|nr:bifunctional metallophosphatase/5'-nucleotidase [Gammaproteobacteria bacterium]